MKEIIKERLEDIVKILVGVILFLTILILIFIYKRSNTNDSLENEGIEEIFLENDVGEDSGLSDLDSLPENDLQETGKMMIDIKGGVESPGVYEMEENSRVIDCIEKAGGFLTEAEQKTVNLAQRTEDQMVIYIPMKGEDLSEFEHLQTNHLGSESESGQKKVDLNKADKEQLKTLNGIGETKAENIISYRETDGFFENIEEIKNISGIGEGTYEKLKDEIQVTP